MKRLLLAACALFAMTLPGSTDIIVDLGVNPTSGQGAFANTNPGTGGGGSGPFIDRYTFDLVGGPQFLTIASVTNVFASPDQFIASFTGSVVNDGPNGVPGGGDDFFVIGPVAAGACIIPVPNCQGFAGAALLDPGHFYLQITGDAGVSSGYGGNLSVAAVPGPIVGAGLPGLLAALSFGGLAYWRKRRPI